jgi:alpha-tubulin suppressor-like RCC1 family protein
MGHTLWLLSDGSVFAAGHNGAGQIGNNSTTAVTGDPVAVPGLTNIVNIWAVGGTYGSSFASRADGAFFCWGNNAEAQLGLGDKTNNKYTPIQNTRSNIVAVAGGSYSSNTHTVLLDNAGFAYAAGYNYYGQCGVGTSGGSASVLSYKLMALPAGVQGTIVQVGTMGYSSSTGSQVLDARGRVWACGNNNLGMLGIGESAPAHMTIPAMVKF